MIRISLLARSPTKGLKAETVFDDDRFVGTRERITTPMIAKVKEALNTGDTVSSFPPTIQREGRPEEVAAPIAYLLGDESRFTTGSSYQIDGGRVC